MAETWASGGSRNLRPSLENVCRRRLSFMVMEGSPRGTLEATAPCQHPASVGRKRHGILTSPHVPWRVVAGYYLCDDGSEVEGLAQGHGAACSGPRGNKNPVIFPSHWGYFHSIAAHVSLHDAESPIRPFLLCYLSGNVHLA